MSMGKEYHAEYFKKNREVFRAHGKTWRLNNLERARENERRSYRKRQDAILKKKYGIVYAQYWEMHAAQGGVCAICKNPCTCGRKLAVDHDHATGKVRALLCSRCNRGIGLFRESADHVRSALEYLLLHQKT